VGCKDEFHGERVALALARQIAKNNPNLLVAVGDGGDIQLNQLDVSINNMPNTGYIDPRLARQRQIELEAEIRKREREDAERRAREEREKEEAVKRRADAIARKKISDEGLKQRQQQDALKANSRRDKLGLPHSATVAQCLKKEKKLKEKELEEKRNQRYQHQMQPPPPLQEVQVPPPPPEPSAGPSHQYVPTAKRPRVEDPVTADFGPVATGTQRLPAPPPPPEPELNEVEAKIMMGLQPPPPPAAGAPPSPLAAAAPSPPPPPPIKMSIKKSDEGGGIQLMNFVPEKKKVAKPKAVVELAGSAPENAWVPDATGSAHRPGRAVRGEKRHRDEKLAPGELPIETQMILKAAAEKKAQEAKAPSVTPSILAEAMERKKSSGRKSKWG